MECFPQIFHSKEANMSLLKELLKDRESKYTVEKGKDNETKGIMPNEDDKTAGSPIHTGPGRE